jgi:hypothetical protein
LLSALACTWPKLHNEPFHRNFEGVADSKERENGARATSLNHLPVPNTEPKGNHVFLAQIPFGSKGSNAVAQSAEKALVFRRKLASRTHYLRLESWRAKTPRTKLRILNNGNGLPSAREERGSGRNRVRSRHFGMIDSPDASENGREHGHEAMGTNLFSNGRHADWRAARMSHQRIAPRNGSLPVRGREPQGHEQKYHEQKS